MSATPRAGTPRRGVSSGLTPRASSTSKLVRSDEADGEGLRAWLAEEHREITATVERPHSIIARTEVVSS